MCEKVTGLVFENDCSEKEQGWKGSFWVHVTVIYEKSSLQRKLEFWIENKCIIDAIYHGYYDILKNNLIGILTPNSMADQKRACSFCRKNQARLTVQGKYNGKHRKTLVLLG